MYRKEAVGGSRAADNDFVSACRGNFVASLSGQHLCRGYETERAIEFDDDLLSKGVMVIGLPGAGKSNVLIYMAYQAVEQMTEDDIAVFFDIKGDYIRYFGNDADSVILGPFNSNAYWNVYEDIMAYGMDDKVLKLRAQTFCDYLFESEKSEKDPFFSNAASHILQGLLLFNIRQADETGDKSYLNNAALCEQLCSLRHDDYVEILSEYTDTASLIDYITENAGSEQGDGVLAELGTVIRRKIVGDFTENGSFSVSEFTKSAGGKKLFLNCNASLMKSTEGIFSYLIDTVITTRAGMRSHRGRVFMFLDEGSFIKPTQLDTAIALMREYKMCIFYGVQTIDMLMRSCKNEAQQRSVLDLFQVLIVLNSSGKTAEYLQKRLGDCEVLTKYTNFKGNIEVKHEHRPAAELYEIIELRTGEAFVKLLAEPPFKFRFYKYF